MDININAIKISLKEAGYFIEKTKPINEGKNSFSFLVKSENKNYFLKIYRKNHINNRARLSSEINFLNYLREIKLKNVPIPILWNLEENWVLLSWVEGEKIFKPDENNCKSLLKFIADIQNYNSSSCIKNIGNASEAKFYISDHFEHINKRIESLKEYLTEYKKNINFRDDIFFLISNFSKEINSYKQKYDFSKNSNLIQNKIISPSDIGFHNVLKNNETINFIDFEYAGWDDPRKLLSDLILQPDHSIPKNYYYTFIKLFKEEKFSQKSLHDTSLILNLYRIKWVLIMLNPIFYKNDDYLSEKLEIILKKSYLYLEDSINRIKEFKNLYLNKYFT